VEGIVVDLMFVVVTVVFFAVCMAYVVVCERLANVRRLER